MPPPRNTKGSDGPSLFDLFLPYPAPGPEAAPPRPAPAPAAAESPASLPDVAPPPAPVPASLQGSARGRDAPPPRTPAPAAAEESIAAPPAPSADHRVRWTPRQPCRPRPEGRGRSYFGPDYDPGIPSYGRVDRLDGRLSLLAAREPRHIGATETRCVFVDTLSGRDVPARWSDTAGMWIETT